MAGQGVSERSKYATVGRKSNLPDVEKKSESEFKKKIQYSIVFNSMRLSQIKV